MAYPYLRTDLKMDGLLPSLSIYTHVLFCVFGYIFLYIMLCVCNVLTGAIVSLLVL